MATRERPMALLSRLDRTADWMRGAGPYSNVVLTCRVRLARNLVGYRFPQRCTEEVLRELAERTLTCVAESRVLSAFETVRLEKLTDLEKHALVDRYLCSRELAQHTAGRALVFDRSGSLSVMINEEDHLRFQCLYSGMQLDAAYRVCSELSEVLESALGFAYSEQWGYLTACPTNVGTGLRASTMMHLPGLTETKRLEHVIGAAAKAGLAVRGLYGEGTETHGCLHQFSNQLTLGKDEETLVRELEDSCKQIASAELDARTAVRTESPLLLKDQIARAYGTLRHARRIDSQETLDCLSWLRWGLEEGMLEGVERQSLNELMVWIRPGVQQALQTRRLPAEERDVLRADLLRRRLEDVVLRDRS